MDKNNTIVTSTKPAKDKGTEKTRDSEFLVTFTRTYEFEGAKISELNLKGIEDLTAESMIKANRVVTASGGSSAFPEFDLQYIFVIASEVTGRPLEFFKRLVPRDAMRIKNTVVGFFFGDD